MNAQRVGLSCLYGSELTQILPILMFYKSKINIYLRQPFFTLPNNLYKNQ